jgi:hypothetical protein
MPPSIPSQTINQYYKKKMVAAKVKGQAILIEIALPDPLGVSKHLKTW